MTNIQKNKSELIAENKHYVELVAKQYLNRGLTLEQLVEEGNKGLIYADQNYDASKGFAFMSYAVWFVRTSILQALSAVSHGESIPETFTPRKRNRVNRD
jgi:RNA polymerase primary sigma factor